MFNNVLTCLINYNARTRMSLEHPAQETEAWIKKGSKPDMKDVGGRGHEM